MSLGNNLFNARKGKGLSQEVVAEKLGVSRQTISKWETDETLPDIQQSKKLAVLYGLTLDELIEFDVDIWEIRERATRYPTKLTGQMYGVKNIQYLSNIKAKLKYLIMLQSCVNY